MPAYRRFLRIRVGDWRHSALRVRRFRRNLPSVHHGAQLLQLDTGVQASSCKDDVPYVVRRCSLGSTHIQPRNPPPRTARLQYIDAEIIPRVGGHLTQADPPAQPTSSRAALPLHTSVCSRAARPLVNRLRRESGVSARALFAFPWGPSSLSASRVLPRVVHGDPSRATRSGSPPVARSSSFAYSSNGASRAQLPDASPSSRGESSSGLTSRAFHSEGLRATTQNEAQLSTSSHE